MECRTVIFDMGGVLLNFDFDIYLNSFREIGLKEIDQIMRCDSDSGKKLIKSMVLRTADRQGMC